MFQEAIKLQFKRKYIIQGVIFFILILAIYTIIDRLNMPYQEMISTFGLYLVIINIITNLLMSFLSAFLMNLSTAMVELKGREGKSSSFGILSIIFGILTYGCTSCIIVFFASIGIAFSVIALPLAGYPYKIVSLILVLIGIFWIKREIDHGKCKIKNP